MKFRNLAAAAVAASLASSALADETVTTTDGRTILLNSDGTYAFVEPAPAAPGSYRQISYQDLRLDIDDLRGERVEVRASVSSMGGMLMLSDPRSDFDTNPIMAEEGDLSRDERAIILNRCNMDCVLTVRGEVSSVMFQSGLTLHSLVQ